MITDNDRAVSSVVAAMLLLVVITTFMSVINAYYIPSLSAKHEIDHMRDVQESFQKIEEIVSLYSYIESKNPSFNQPPATKVTIPLGDGGLPLISTISSSGSIATRPDSSWINVSLYFNQSGSMTPAGNDTSGYFKYRASNNFWIDQEFTFENGAIILTQGQKSLVRSEPLISVSNEYNKSRLSITLFNVTGDKQILTGNGMSTVKMKVRHRFNQTYTDVENVTIVATNPNRADAWNKYFSDCFKNNTTYYENESKVVVYLTTINSVDILISDVEFEIN